MTKYKLLSREEFREAVKDRDGSKCIVCREPSDESHHIIERRLWNDGGYYLDNGASLCNHHHKQAEENILCPQYLRYLLGIDTIAPKEFIDNIDYNKWGDKFDMPREKEFKYPTTWYLPFSPTVADEDKRNKYNSVKHLVGVPLVISRKMDGSNIRISKEKVAARNGFSAEHHSFDMLKSMFESKLRYVVEGHLYIFGEWVYAKHSIEYKDDLALDDYFQCFSIYDMRYKIFLDWHDTKVLCEAMGISIVPIIEEYKIFNTEWELIKYLSSVGEEVVREGHEGIVVRSAYGYHFSQHKDFVLKYVRENHVQTNKMWSHLPLVRNKLK